MGLSGGNNKPKPPPSATPAVEAIKEKSLFEQVAEERLKKYEAWKNSEGRDIMQAPGMDDLVDVYGSAESLAAKDRMANPGRALSGGGSGDYAAQLDTLEAADRYDTRARGLSDGLRDVEANAYGAGASAAEMGARRKEAYAQASLTNENNYYNRPKPVPLWQKIAGIAIGGLGAAGTAGGAGGVRALFKGI